MLTHCEPAEEARPPATAQDVPPPPPSPPPPAPGEAPGEEATQETAGGLEYSSGEVAVGEDSDSYDDNDPAALTDFRGALDPHGAWVDDPKYGTVWVPSPEAVGPDFTPYVTAGHWAYDDDWVWVSDYPWGWAPFHYGRWVFVEGRGWGWIPGRVYRGAWVVWGVDDGYGYLGWAPAPPAFIWFGGVAVGWGYYVAPRWAYCPRGQIFAPAVSARIVAAPAVGPVAARVHLYTAAAGAPAGPAPQRFGYTAAQIPHATGTAAASVAHAQQFARPSSAQSLGARGAMRVAPPALPAAAARSTVSTPRPSISTAPRVGSSPAVHSTSPGVVRSPGFGTGTAHPSVIRSAPVSVPHSMGGGHLGGGGGHHR